jgi:O-methyltransferase
MIKKFILDLFNKGRIIRGPINLNDRQGALHKAWGHVFSSHLKGDYVEFGIHKGDTFIASYKEYLGFKKWLEKQTVSSEEWRRTVANNYVKNEVKFHGLDTFEGMPSNNEGNVMFAEGTFMSSLEEVQNKCVNEGVKNFYLHKGLFTESTEILSRKISSHVAIVNIDGDLYESAVDALNIIEPYLQIGTVILFDEFNAFNADNSMGERKAFNEFTLKSDFIFEKWFTYLYCGQAFLCVGQKKN